MNERSERNLPEAMSFRELADAIANGKVVGTTSFNLFLQKGVEYWQLEAQKPGPFQDTYLGLVDNYSQALNGSNRDRMRFCEDEAVYLLKLAEDMIDGGVDPGKTQDLNERAENWLRVSLNFTLTGEESGDL